MNKWTRGPWTVRSVEAHGSTVQGPFGVAVAWCGVGSASDASGWYAITTREAQANAHLIAAAPDLAAVADLVLQHASIEMPEELISAASAALRRARGERP